MNPLSFQSAFCIIHALSLVFSCPGGYNHHRGVDTELHICTQKGCTMNNTLLATSQRMIELRDILKKVFRFESSYIYPVCAAALLQSEEPLSEDELTHARDLVRQSTGIFSNFRSMMLMPTACYLAAHGNDTAYLHEALDLYERLKKTFRGSEYTALLSLVLPDLEDADALIARGHELYRQMNKAHPLLTGSEDKPAAVLMAASTKSDEDLMRDMEDAYRRLKSSISFADSNSIQTLAQMLAGGDTFAAVDRLLALLDQLDHAGRKYGKSYELSALGVLALHGPEPQQIVEDMLEADAFLREQKGYGFFGYSARTRLMHAAMLVGADLKHTQSPYVMTSTISMVIAMNAAMCAIAASSAASSSSSSSH